MPDNNGNTLTIIVVDDCGDIRLMLSIRLKLRGYLVEETENGQVAVELAKRKCLYLICKDSDEREAIEASG
jgi:DNA-binding NtrC family response regulator